MRMVSKSGLFCILLLAVLLSSCKFIQPTFGGFNIKSVKPGKEGEMDIEAEVKVDNPNNYSIWVKKGNMDILMDNGTVGTVKTEGVTTIKAKSNDYATVHLKAKIDQGGALMGALSGVMGGAMPKLKFKGSIRAGVFIVGKKFDVEFSDKLPAGSGFNFFGN